MAAKAELRIEATANTTQATQKLKELKREGVDVSDEIRAKNEEALKGVIGQFAPMMLAVTAIYKLLGLVAQGFQQMGERAAKLRETAEALNVSASTVAELEARAAAAGVSAKDYAEAIDDLKNGVTTVEELADAWRKSGDGAKYAAEMTKSVTALATDKALQKFRDFFGAIPGFLADSAAFLVGLDASGEAAIETAVRSGVSKDKAVEMAMRADPYTFYRSTVGNEERRRELADLYDTQLAQQKEDEKRSRDTAIKTLYDELGGDVAETIKQLRDKLKIDASESAVLAAVKRATEALTPWERAAEEGKQNIKDAEELAKAEEAERKETEKREADLAKTAVSYAYAQGGGLLAGLSYGPMVETVQDKQLRAMEGTEKATNEVKRSVDQLRKEMLGK